MAGEGGADHPRSGREDDLFRGRAARILRRPDGLFAVSVGARSDGEAQDRLADAEATAPAPFTGSACRCPIIWALAPDYDFDPHADDHDAGRVRCCRASGASGCSTAPTASAPRASSSSTRSCSVKDSTPGYRDWRGSIETAGQFNLSDKWVWGWDGTLLSDKNYLQDYGLHQQRRNRAICSRSSRPTTRCRNSISRAAATAATSMRARCTSTASRRSDVQGQIPVVHPVIDHDYVFKSPIFGGELSFHSNLTSLSRDTANFDPISQAAVQRRPVRTDDRRSRRSRTPPIACCAACPAPTRALSAEANWRRTVIDPWGQMFTPFVTVRADVAAHERSRRQTGVSNYIRLATRPTSDA